MHPRSAPKQGFLLPAVLLLLPLAVPLRAVGAEGEPVLAVPPRLKSEVPPELPPGTIFPGPEVVVVLQIDLAADGKVEKVALVEGAGEPFDGAAQEAVRRYAFDPAQLAGGTPVPVSITYRLRILAPPPAAVPEPPRPVRLSGRLLERGTRKPLASVSVAAQVGERVLEEARTGQDGSFALQVAEPTFSLIAVPPGHDRLETKIEAKPGEEREQTFYLQAKLGQFFSVVRGERVRSEITKQVIPAQEISRIAGTQGDTLKAVLNLPGAARPFYGGGGLVLRGSSPADSAAFVDGIQIPVLYHFGGLRSTFATRFLESIEFVPGNFSADHGRLQGGIVSARVRDPARDLFRGEVDLNLYDVGISVEGPVSEHWSLGGAFRRSWIDTILPLFLSEDDALSFTSAPRFYDYQFLATYKPDERDQVRFLFFGSQDKLVALINRPAEDPSITGNLRFRIAYHQLQTTWSHTFTPELRQESTLGVGMQEIDTAVGQGLFFDLETKRLDLRSTWTWQVLPSIAARAGLDFQTTQYDIALDVPTLPTEGQASYPVSTSIKTAAIQDGVVFAPGFFAELRLTPIEALAVVPAIRADWQNDIHRWTFDPRLAVRWTVAPNAVLKAAIGIHHQPPDSAQTDPTFGTPGLLSPRSVQGSAGAEYRLMRGIDIDVTGFYKDLRRLAVSNRLSDVVPSAPRYTDDGKGRIFGVEALVRARFGEKFFGWIAYTFQRSFRTDRPGEAERLFTYDQPHILTALGTYQFNPRWSLGARFRLVSGNPYTPIVPPYSIYEATHDVYVPIYGATMSERLGTFHALDLRLDRTWIFQRWKLSAYLDVQNAYNRGNQEGWQYNYDYSRKTPLTGLPILPILGVKAEW